jgi:membrane protein YqaA with SNARE-associated domain
MFGKIVFLFVGLFVQELITFNALILATHQGYFPIILIHALFIIATIIDIIVGFYLGRYLHNKSSQTKIATYIQKISDRFSTTKKYHRWLALLILGNVSFPYVNSCIAGYLGMPFWESSFFIFLGDVIWYISLWGIVLGISSITKNIYFVIGGVVLVSLVIHFIVRRTTGSQEK